MVLLKQFPAKKTDEGILVNVHPAHQDDFIHEGIVFIEYRAKKKED